MYVPVVRISARAVYVWRWPTHPRGCSQPPDTLRSHPYASIAEIKMLTIFFIKWEWIYNHVCIYMYVWMYEWYLSNAYERVYTLDVCIHVWVLQSYEWVYVCMYVCMHECMNECMYEWCLNADVCMYMYVKMSIPPE